MPLVAALTSGLPVCRQARTNCAISYFAVQTHYNNVVVNSAAHVLKAHDHAVCLSCYNAAADMLAVHMAGLVGWGVHAHVQLHILCLASCALTAKTLYATHRSKVICSAFESVHL